MSGIFLCTTKNKRDPSKRLMAASRVLKKFPLNLGIGTDICQVSRIRRMLSLPRAHDFVQKILNTNERAHPKIQWLAESPTLEEKEIIKEPTAEPSLVHVSNGRDTPRIGPRPTALYEAATFMAGRCVIFPALK